MLSLKMDSEHLFSYGYIQAPGREMPYCDLKKPQGQKLLLVLLFPYLH